MRLRFSLYILVASASIVGCDTLRTRDAVQSAVVGTQAITPATPLMKTSISEARAPSSLEKEPTSPSSTVPVYAKLQQHSGEQEAAEWISAPEHRGSRLFFAQKKKGEAHSALLWKSDGPKSETKLILDPNLWIGKLNQSLENWHVDWSGRYIAYTVMRENNEASTFLEVIDVDTGVADPLDHLEGMKQTLPGRLDQPTWDPREDGFYYTAEHEGVSEVRYHKLHTPQSEDTLIGKSAVTNDVESTDLLDGFRSRDARWEFLVTTHASTYNEISYRPFLGPDFKPFFKFTDSHSWLFTSPNRFFLVTDAQAPNRRILWADVFHTPLEWHALVRENKEALITYVAVVGGHLLVQRLRDGHSELEVVNYDGQLVRKVKLPSLSTVQQIAFDQYDNFAYIKVASKTLAPKIYRLSIPEGDLTPW
jgi:prolyl oligopeptidase